MTTDQTESKLAYLSISKAKANTISKTVIKYMNQMKIARGR